MKRIILLILVTLVMTGCSAEYKITIDEKSINEEFLGLERNSVITNGIVTSKLDEIIVTNSDESTETGFYTFEKFLGNYESGIKMTYLYEEETDFKNYSVFLNRCYDTTEFVSNKEVLKINTSNSFKCFDYFSTLDSVKIEINTKYKVVKNNADYKDKESYFWDISKDNKMRPIQFEIVRELANPSLLDIINSSVELQMAIIFGVLLVIPSVFISMAYFKYKKINQI